VTTVDAVPSNPEGRLSLEDALSLANAILGLVEEAAQSSPGVPTRDRCDVILLAAYGRAYRCFRSIREIAARGEADDAMVLVRALLGLMLRAVYIVQPDAPEERERRLAQWIGKSRRDQRAMLQELKALGYEFTDDDLRKADELAADKAWAGTLPGDKRLAEELELTQFYSHVYRSASDATHYGIFTMLEGFETPPQSVSGEGASVSLDKVDRSRAADSLMLGITVYGAFLENTDSVVGHGVTDRAAVLVRAQLGM